jgi:hypothetical protein
MPIASIPVFGFVFDDESPSGTHEFRGVRLGLKEPCGFGGERGKTTDR